MIGWRETADEPVESPTAAGRVIALALSRLAPSERYCDIAILAIGGAHPASRSDRPKDIRGPSVCRSGK